MKVYLGKPRDHWISPYTILEKIIFWRKINYDEPLIEKWSDRLLPFCNAYQEIMNRIFPSIHYVKVDNWDTWSMDYTLSPIIAPMLKQLKATKHGAPIVDDEDVPEGVNLRSTEAPPKEEEWDIDNNHFKRYDWVLDEMIWTFETLSDINNESKFYEDVNVDESAPLEEQIQQIEIDREGLDAHNKRIQNGLRLFSKYYRTLWD